MQNSHATILLHRGHRLLLVACVHGDSLYHPASINSQLPLLITREAYRQRVLDGVIESNVETKLQGFYLRSGSLY